MCAPANSPEPGTFSPFQLDASTLRALSDPGYVDARAFAERARQLGVSVSSVVVPVRQPLPSMAHQKRPDRPQPQGGLPQVKSFD